MKKVILLSLAAVLVAGCGSKNKPATDNTLSAESRNMPMYFSGDFVYFADAAVFFDCQTGQRFNVKQNDVYMKVEKKYMSLKLEPKESVSLDVKGYLIPRPEGEEGLPFTLVMTEFLEMDPELECDHSSIKVGNYVFETDTLTINPDYTYAKGGKHGNWGLVDDSQMFFISDADTTYANIDLWSSDLTFGEAKYIKQY